MLWYIQTQSINNLKQEITLISSQSPNPSPSGSLSISNPSAPPASAASWLSAIQTNLDNLNRRLDKIEGLPTPTPAASAIAKSVPFQKQVLTLGSANTASLSWSPTGLEIAINSADYPASVMAYFEAGLNSVNGIASARITNKTTGAIINLSEVSNNTNTVTWKRSAGFKLHPGNNNYLVELRSSGGEVVYLSSSRIVIEKP
jgi:hypothetical protein